MLQQTNNTRTVIMQRTVVYRLRTFCRTATGWRWGADSPFNRWRECHRNIEMNTALSLSRWYNLQEHCHVLQSFFLFFYATFPFFHLIDPFYMISMQVYLSWTIRVLFNKILNILYNIAILDFKGEWKVIRTCCIQETISNALKMSWTGSSMTCLHIKQLALWIMILHAC